MNIEEIKEGAEHAHEKGEKKIGLTMAITAVLLAMTTLLSHRAHTEEVVLQGERNTQWVNYDSKRGDAHMYTADAKIAALLPNGEKTAEELRELAKIAREGEPAKGNTPAKEGTEKIGEHALELDAEMKVTQKRADYFDASELFLEISIVLCSISLLTESRRYWQLSFAVTVLGVCVALFGLLMVH